MGTLPLLGGILLTSASTSASNLQSLNGVTYDADLEKFIYPSSSSNLQNPSLSHEVEEGRDSSSHTQEDEAPLDNLLQAGAIQAAGADSEPERESGVALDGGDIPKELNFPGKRKSSKGTDSR